MWPSVNACVHEHTYTCERMCRRGGAANKECACMHVHVCTCESIFVCACVCACVCVCVCACVCACVHVCAPGEERQDTG